MLEAIKVAQTAPQFTAQAFEQITTLWAASLTALEQSVEKAELAILGKIHLEQPFAELAGTPFKNPFIHFSEALIEKTGADKVAAQAADIGAQVVKATTYAMETFVAASKTTAELSLKHGTEIASIIKDYTNKCRAIGLELPDMRTFQHVISRHMAGGSSLVRDKSGKLRSIFNVGEDWIKLGIETWEKGALTEPGVKVYDFGRVIGTSLETGEGISKVKIVTNPGKWTTIYPLENL